MFGRGRQVKITPKSSINFRVNGCAYGVSHVDPNKSLNTWLRENCLTGSKVMCSQGGCGACVVSVYYADKDDPISINSCLMPLYSADGCNIITADGVGSIKKGFTEIQERMTQHGATQCGYCTPGFVMSIYSKVNSNESFTEQDMEDHLDGHICRCTGYRSILDAARSFVTDQIDIEDLTEKPCMKSCPPNCGKIRKKPLIKVCETSSTKWYRPSTLDELKALMLDEKIFDNSSSLVCSNTSTGIYKNMGPQPAHIIDISRVSEFRHYQVSSNWRNTSKWLKVGAAVTLNHLCDLLLQQQANRKPDNIFRTAVDHLKRVAGNPIRNVASWAGNIMIMYRHRDFPSDVAIILEGLMASISVFDSSTGKTEEFSVFGPNGIMSTDMDKKVIVSMDIPIPDEDLEKATVFKTYKIMPRSQNSHAYINAVFRVEFTEDNMFDEDICIVIGNIRPNFAHATNTEDFLVGKDVSESTFKEALSILEKELKPIQNSEVDVDVKSKTDISLSLFYKFFLNCVKPSHLDQRLLSATTSLQRPLSSGTQSFTTNAETYPVSEPIPKMSSLIQTSGQAYYISDLPASVNEVHCAFVLSTRGNVDIDKIDDSYASLQPGFVRIITGDNYPTDAKNLRFGQFDTTQPLLPKTHVDYAGQPIALVLADTEEQARSIASQVVISYKNEGKVITETRDAVAAKSFYDLGIEDIVVGDPVGAMESAANKVSGKIDLGSQYHFYMENQISRVELNDEGGFLVESATQCQAWVQEAISYMFQVSSNKVEVKTKRIGGAYGGKATNSLVIALAAALGAHVTGRPCRFHADIQTCMASLGSRIPYSLDYTVGFDNDGIMQALDWTVYTNSGCSSFDNEASDDGEFKSFGDSAYYCENCRIKRICCKTNIASGTWCRAPGSLQLTAFADYMMEHIADYLEKDAIDVKYANLYKNQQMALDGQPLLDCHISEMYTSIIEKAQVKQRSSQIDDFNSKNIYKKRGIAVTPMKYPLSWLQMVKYNVLLTINAIDGSVLVSHGGIESGQGLDTKVIQVVAYGLDINVDQIVCQRTCTITSANSQVTGGSTTSELVCRSAIECCEILVSRMKEVKDSLPTDTTWQQLVTACDKEDVDLTVSCATRPPRGNERRYNVWGVTVSEVELDVLTGQHLIRRVDIIEDCGVSLNPIIDVGQVEGAFVMSLGFWLNEKMVHDQTTGQLLTHDTWEYKPPTTKDIPVEWNIEFFKGGHNEKGVYNSKATGEPPLCMAVSVVHALRRCVDDSLNDRSKKDGFTMIDQPLVPTSIKSALKLAPASDFTVFSCSIM